MEISENKFISLIRKFGLKNNRVVRGIGDDGAVIDLEDGRYVCVQDAMAEHIHFEFSFMDPYYVGKKALYSNISDILAMGAQPMFYLVTTGIPPHMTSNELLKLYRGMMKAATEFGVTLLGGDTVACAHDFFIDISVIGRVIARHYFGREKAKSGDYIAVTGKLGEAAMGLKILKENGNARGFKNCIDRFLSPAPPLALWKELVKNDITDAVMDISDGLLMDLSRMMQESKKQARIDLDLVPMPNQLKKKGLENLALSGGEDYQLLFTFRPEKLPAVKNMTSNGGALTVIGRVTKGKGVRVFSGAREITGLTMGFDHFRRKSE